MEWFVKTIKELFQFVISQKIFVNIKYTYLKIFLICIHKKCFFFVINVILCHKCYSNLEINLIINFLLQRKKRKICIQVCNSFIHGLKLFFTLTTFLNVNIFKCEYFGRNLKVSWNNFHYVTIYCLSSHDTN